MKFLETSIPGCYRLEPVVHRDARGTFVKTFVRDAYAAHGLEVDFPEMYHSASARGALRGLHFQVPPHDHVKVVTCVHGTIADAVVDLRVGSPTYGRHELFELDAAAGTVLYVPSGLAHGFQALTDGAVVTYRTSTVHAPAHDAGVHWASAGIAWPIANPVTSDRDARFPALEDYASPFTFTAGPRRA